MAVPAVQSLLASRVGAQLSVHLPGSWDVAGLRVVRFLTRWGRFTEASLEPDWQYIGRVRMLGPWFDGDEVYAVLVGRYFATDPPWPRDFVVTNHVDIEGIPMDAPGYRPMGWHGASTTTGYVGANSAAIYSDTLTGERSEVGRLYVPMSGHWGANTQVHVARRDAAWLLSQAVHQWEVDGNPAIWTYGDPDNISWGKHLWLRAAYGPDEDAGLPAASWQYLYLRTLSTVRWADGTTEQRSRTGADTMLQRVTVQLSSADPTPNKPVIIGGSPQWVNPAAPSTLALTYSANLAGAQAVLVWKRTIGADVKYWNQTTQAWQAGVFENNRSQPNTTFPAAAFPADSTFTIQVAAKGTTGGLSEYSDAVTIDTHPGPTDAVIGLTPYDAGTEITASLSPTVTVGGTPAEGQTLDSYVVEVLDAESLRFAYADVAGLAPWVVDPPLPNNTTGWTVRARVRQSGGALSDWVSLPFDVAAVVPGAPDVTVTPTAHETSGLPVQRVTVDLPWETDGFDYVTNPLTLDVDRRVYDVAGDWVRAGSVTPTPGWASNIVLDDDAPSHLPVLYRVRARSTTQYGGELVGAWSAAVPGYPIDDGAWLSAHGFPELAVRVDLVTADEGKIVSGQSGTTVIGAPHQVVTGVASVTGDGGYVARTDTPEDEAALVSLLAGGHLLTLSMTPERDSYGDVHTVPRRWFRTVGDVGVARVAQGPWTMRLVSWTATPQAVPATVAGG